MSLATLYVISWPKYLILAEFINIDQQRSIGHWGFFTFSLFEHLIFNVGQLYSEFIRSNWVRHNLLLGFRKAAGSGSRGGKRRHSSRKQSTERPGKFFWKRRIKSV